MGLGSTIHDVADAWKIFNNILGVKSHITKMSETAYEFDHYHCPIWEYYQRKGHNYCAVTCLPMADEITRYLCPKAEMMIIQAPTLEQTCIKRSTTITT